MLKRLEDDGKSLLLDAAVIEQDDLIGDFQSFVLIMRDEDTGDAHRLLQLSQPTSQFLAHLGVQCTKGFVE